MMREGVLMTEEPPEIFMSHCNATSVEDAFLTLSHKQETSSNTCVYTQFSIKLGFIAFYAKIVGYFYKKNRK